MTRIASSHVPTPTVVGTSIQDQFLSSTAEDGMDDTSTTETAEQASSQTFADISSSQPSSTSLSVSYTPQQPIPVTSTSGMLTHVTRFAQNSSTIQILPPNSTTSQFEGSTQNTFDNGIFNLLFFLLIPIGIAFVICYYRRKKRQYYLNEVARTLQYRENAGIYLNTCTTEALTSLQCNVTEEFSLHSFSTCSDSNETMSNGHVYDSIEIRNSSSFLEQEGYLVPATVHR